MECIIYKITNLINNSHVLHKGRPKLFNAIHKYGKSNFTIEKLLSVKTQKEADMIECEMILKYNTINSGYNIQNGGRGGKHSTETKIKISNTCKGKKLSEIVKNKISKAHLGIKFSTNTKKKMSIMKMGKHTNVGTEFKKGHILNRKFSYEEEQNIIAIYLRIKSCCKVAVQFNCSPCTILNIMKRSGNKIDSTVEAETK